MKNDMLSLLARARRDHRGNASIEFAFIGSILIIMTIGAFDLGRLAYTYFSLQRATGLATRMVGMGATDDAIRGAIKSHFPPDEQDAVTVNFSRPQDTDGLSYVRVDAEYPLPLIVPGFNLFQRAPGNAITVRAVQVVPVN